MSVFFGFSDESGCYAKERDDRFIKSHPYYIRALLLIEGEQYSYLEREFKNLKKEFGLPLKKEVKWSYIWPLRKYQKFNENVPENKDYYFLKDYDYHKLIEFMDCSLGLLDKLNKPKIYLTITNNCNSRNKFELKDCFKMHITSLLERIQMTLQYDENNLAVIFFDPLETNNRNSLLRNVYYHIRENGSFVESFPNIKDSLNLEYSHQSVGIQLADYICGFTYGHLKGYNKSEEIFKKQIFGKIRKNYNTNSIMGYGVKVIPSDKKFQETIIKSFSFQ